MTIVVNLVSMALLKKIPQNNKEDQSKEIQDGDIHDSDNEVNGKKNKGKDEKDKLVNITKNFKIVYYGEYNLCQALKLVDFHCIMWPIVISLSVSFTYAFNLPVFLKSYDLENLQAPLYLTGAACGSLSKLLFGFLSDLTLSKHPRLVYLVLTLAVQTAMMLLNCIVGDNAVVATLNFIVYFTSLAVFLALTPMIVPEYFGTTHFASIWGIITVFAGFAALAMSYIMGASCDQNIEGDGDTCYGLKCFRPTSIIAVLLCAIGFILLLSIYFRHIRLLANEEKSRDNIQNSVSLSETEK